MDEVRSALAAAVRDRGETLLGLSRLIGRNDAYLHQFVHRGSPRRLAERDRAKLAAFLAIDEALLGGEPRGAELVEVRRLDVAASAGPGRLVEEEEGEQAAALLDPRLLRVLGVKPANASIIAVTGDSMAPLLAHGDDILVDRGSRRPGSGGGVYVVRVDGMVLVKRVAACNGGWLVTSDNPAHESVGLVSRTELEVLGRVVWQSRVL